MPVRKFRSVEEMSQPVWRDPGSPELLEAIRRVWEFGDKTSMRSFRPGVYKYRSVEEMQEGLQRIVIEKRPPQ